MKLSLSTLAGVLFCCLLCVLPLCASAQALPVPVNATATLIDRTTGQPLAAATYTNFPCYLHIVATNTRPADVAAATMSSSLLVTSNGTNADGTNGTKTTPMTLLSRAAVSNAVTFTVTLPAPAGLVPDGALPAGLSFTANTFTVPMTLAGGASGIANFPCLVTF